MTIFNLFIEFVNRILNFKILDIELSSILITLAIVTVIFWIIKGLSGETMNSRKKD